MKRNDTFPTEQWKQELDQLHMPKETAVRALSRMKGEERNMFKRTAIVAVLAMLLVAFTVGGTLAHSGSYHVDKTENVMMTLSQTSVVIPGKNGLAGCIFTLEDALYDGKRILLAYKIENNRQIAPHADMQSDAMR